MKNLIRSGVATLIVTGMVACSSESKDVDTNIESAKVEAIPKVYESPGKTSAPIEMSYKILTGDLQPGKEISVQVNLTSPLPAPVKTTLNLPENMQLNNAKTEFTMAVDKTGVREEMPVLKVIAPENGVYYIRMVASVEQEGRIVSKPFTIPVRVGQSSEAQSKNTELVKDIKGQNLTIQKGDTRKQVNDKQSSKNNSEGQDN